MRRAEFLTSLILLHLIKWASSLDCNDSCNSSWFTKNCKCNGCDTFDDCCADAKLIQSQNHPNQYSCNVKIDEYKWIYSIEKCNPTLNSNRNIIEKCQSNHFESDLVNLVPVFYKNKTYKNLFCVICNSEKIDFEMINFFEINIDGVRDRDENSTILDLTELEIVQKPKQSFGFRFPKNIDSIYFRDCLKTIDTCSSANDNLTEICKNHTAIRYHFNGINYDIYKNEYCAACNGVDINDLRCQIIKPRKFFSQNLQILFELKNFYGEIKVSLEIRFDFTSDFVSLNQSECKNSNLTKQRIGEFICTSQNIMNENFVNDELCNKEIGVNSSSIIKNIITFIGQIISIICLILLLLIYISNRALRNLAGKILISLSVSLMFSQVMFLIAGYSHNDNQNVNFCAKNKFPTTNSLLKYINEFNLSCYLSGLFIHYFYLVFFFWTNVMAFDLYKTFDFISPRSKRNDCDEDCSNESTKFLKYSVYAWLTPLCPVLVNMSFQFYFTKSAYGFNNRCFISDNLDLLFYFIIPVFFILIANSYFLACSILTINQVDKMSRRYLKQETLIKNSSKIKRNNTNNEQKQRIVLYLKLFILFGMSWSLGIINSIIDNKILWYLYTILNSLQGFFIFISFVFNTKTRRQLKNSKFLIIFSSKCCFDGSVNKNSNTQSTSFSNRI